MIGMGAYLYVVSGPELYRVDIDGNAVLLGSINGASYVSMAHNGTQVAIVTAAEVYVATESSLTLLAVAPCTAVAFQDGYGLFSEQNSQRFSISPYNDFLSYDQGDFALANAVPDNITGLVNVNRETWVFGERTAQVYYNSGNPDFPFDRIASGVIERGCNAPRTICQYQGRVFWLGDDLRVYGSTGYQPVPISTHAIERFIATYANTDDAVAFVYEQEGHVFYCLGFAEKTWVYDISTGLWHERVSYGLNYWRVKTGERHFGLTLGGDSLTGAIYTLDLDTYTDAGLPILRIATSPPIFADTLFATMWEVRADFEAGVGLYTGQGSDPEAMLRWSDDGGNTWSSEHRARIGAIGQRQTRARWTRLGNFRQRCLEISVSDPVKFALMDVFISAEGGTT
jgi:hypothetical protein